jgi:hypothetical protein
MRNPDRIARILKTLERYWYDNPNMRLDQIVGNCYGAGDSYYMEDDRIERFLLTPSSPTSLRSNPNRDRPTLPNPILKPQAGLLDELIRNRCDTKPQAQ